MRELGKAKGFVVPEAQETAAPDTATESCWRFSTSFGHPARRGDCSWRIWPAKTDVFTCFYYFCLFSSSPYFI